MLKSVEASPCNAATYVGNRPIKSLDLVGPDKRTLREKYFIGEPRDCPAGTAEEMKARGFVGIYRKEAVTFYRFPNSNRVVPKTW